MKKVLSLTLCLVLTFIICMPARASPDTEYTTVLKATLDKIQSTVPDPESGSTYGEWAVLALARGGVEDEIWYGQYLDNLFPVIDACGGNLHGEDNSYTEYSRVIIGLSAVSQDASQINTGNGIYDLVSPLRNKKNNGQYWASDQGNNGTIFALVALDTQNYLDNDAGRAARRYFMDALLSAQLSNGAWEISEGSGANIDMTAMALQALAPYYLSSAIFGALGTTHTFAQLQTGVANALSYLNTVKTNDYGSVEAAAQVVVALAALNRDAADDTLLGDVMSSMLTYYLGEGGFTHLKKTNKYNQMATEQAAYALVAYDRWKNGKTSLYNMTDQPSVASISITAPTAATVTQLTSGKFTVTCQSPCVAVVQKAGGTYATLTPEGSGDTRTFHTTKGSVWVFIRGDANGDGKLNVFDLLAVKSDLLHRTQLDAIHKLAADANKDQVVNMFDLLRIKAKLLNKSNMNW